MPTIIEQLAAYAAHERTALLSDEVRHHARRAVIDWFATLLPGTLLPPATLLAAPAPACARRPCSMPPPATPSSSTTFFAMPSTIRAARPSRRR
jgi:2-methylcitrate dehydratase PrpD